MPEKGKCYRWNDVPGKGFCFLRFGDGNCIVTAAIDPDLNPDAPEIILVEGGHPRESRADQLCKQLQPISVYLKRDVNKWEYRGEFVSEGFTESEEEIRQHAQRSERDNIFRIIYLKECELERTVLSS